MSVTSITITTPDTAAMVLDQLDPQSGASSLDSLKLAARYIDGVANGAFYFSQVKENVGGVAAHSTMTFSSTGPTNGQYVTVNGSHITFETSGATGDQININSDPAVVARDVAALLNSSTTFNGLVSATSTLGVVTLTAAVPGVIGNLIAITVGTASNTAVGNATLVSGADGTVVLLK